MTHRASVVLDSADLQIGESKRTLCPSCGGGSTREKSLSVTRGEDNNLIWQCFRASCEESGRTGVPTNSPTIITPTKAKPRKIFEGRTDPLPDRLIEKVHILWGITNPPHWYYTSEYGGRIAMSVRSPKYLHRGWVLRDVWNRSQAKTLNFIEDNEVSLSWYKNHAQRPTVLVEDIPSAIRAAKYVNAVALLGTGIGLEKAQEIAQHATGPVVVALDQDATNQSFDLLYKYALLWDNPIILPLQKDLKNLTEEELCRKLKEINPLL